MNKRIIVADILSNTVNGNQTGHYFAVARNYLDIFGGNCAVAGGPIYKNSFASGNLIVLPYNCEDGEHSINMRLKTFANAKALFKAAKGDVIVLQQCSTITALLCILLFHRHTSRLFLIQYNLQGLRNKAGRCLFGLVKRKIDGIVCPNEEVGKAYGIPYCVVPDYIYIGGEKHPLVSYDDKKYDFCVVGRISEEKGVVEVVKSLANTPYKVVIAGRPQTEELGVELRELCRGVSNIELILGFISDEEYRNYLNKSRYALLNYQGEYSNRSSGVVYDTLFSGLPVVGCKCKALQFIENYGMGYLYKSIKEFTPSDILDKTKHAGFQKNIDNYRLKHQEYKVQLGKFLFL